MHKYRVIVCPITSPSQVGAFVGIDFGKDGYAEFDEHDFDGNEIHTVVSEADISRQLDLRDGVISYEVVYKPPGIIIVTRHEALVKWLAREGITGEVIQQAVPEDVAGKDVYGVLPLWLAVHANSVTEVSMPDITLEQRKRVADLTIEEMDEAGAHMVTYVAEVK